MSHLKSNQIDEKIKQLEEQPTNNTYGLMTVGDPSHTVQPPDIEVTELDFNLGNDDDDGKDTRGIFNAEGEILTIEPDVGDTSYILGPMASMWYSWGNFSTFGYIREADRKMVNLGKITGRLSNWDGESGFTSYGQLTLEQAVWFMNTPKKDNAGNDASAANYRAFYPGPPSNVPDQYGRYLCTITGTAKPFDKTPPPYVTSPTQGPESASDQFSGQKDQAEKEKDKNKDKSEEDERKELMKRAREIDAQSKKTVDYLNSQGVGQDQAAAMAIPLLAPWLVKSLVAAAGVMSLEQLRQAVSSWNGVYQSTSDKSWEDEFLDGPGGEAARERSRQADREAVKDAQDKVNDADQALDDAKASGDQGAIDKAQEQLNNAEKNRERVQNQVTANRKGRGRKNRPGGRNRTGSGGTASGEGGVSPGMHGNLGMYNSYKPKGKVLTESRRRILREIKKPYKVPKTPTKFKGIKPRVRVTGKGLMEVPEIPKQFKPEPTIWRKHNYDKNIKASQEKKNEVLE